MTRFSMLILAVTSALVVLAAADSFGTGLFDPRSGAGNAWGDARLLTPPALGAWALGALSGDHRFADTGDDATRGLVMTYDVNGILKQAVGWVSGFTVSWPTAGCESVSGAAPAGPGPSFSRSF